MTALITLEDVTIARSGKIVLDRISMSLQAGERLALVGRNGAGKTTLLRSLVGLEKPQSGTISAFGAACRTERDFQAVRRRIAYLFQDPDDQLFCPTVLDDVAFGPLNLGLSTKLATTKAHETLERLGLGHLANRITHRLSGGEKRLVSLAGILAMEPEVLLLDEPTNGLDDEHLTRLTAILESLPVAMIIVCHHRPFLQRMAQRIVLLADGRLTPAAFHRHAHDHPHLHGLEDDDHQHHR